MCDIIVLGAMGNTKTKAQFLPSNSSQYDLMVDAIRYNAGQKDAVRNVEKVLGEFGEDFFPTKKKKKHYLYLIFKYV